MSAKSKSRRLLEDLAVTIGALMLITVSAYLDPSTGLLSLIMGVMLSAVAAMDICFSISDAKISLKSFRDNKKGIAWVWVTAALSIGFCPFIYWAIGWPLDIVETQLLGVATYTGFMASVYTLLKLLASYLLAFVLLFTVIWSFVQAKSRQGYA